MHINANRAGSFNAIAHYEDSSVKTASFGADATIKEIFAAFWPQDEIAFRFKYPVRLELTADERTTPPDERFKEMFPTKTSERSGA